MSNPFSGYVAPTYNNRSWLSSILGTSPTQNNRSWTDIFYNPYPSTVGYNPNVNSNYPSNVSVVTNPVTGQVEISQNPDRIQQWINAALSGLALIRGAQTIPTATPANQGYGYNQQFPVGVGNVPAVDNNLGGNLGASVQGFIQNNFTAIAIGLGVYLLWSSGRKR